MTPTALFATGWQPQIKGNLLRPCALLTELIENEEGPRSRDPSDADWKLSSYSSLLEEVQYAKRAIVESVVAVWRLRQTEEEGPADALWGDHLEAWLVRGFLFTSGTLLLTGCGCSD
jgi:hypothetical protein